jgi:competence protein ComEA
MDTLPFPVSTRRLVAGGVLVLALLVVGVRHLHARAASSPALLRVAPVRVTRAPAAATGRIVVDVEGAVRRPGLVHLSRGARVVDAVTGAGGTTRRADRAAVNLAAPVSDGQQVVVPARGAGAAAGVGAAGSSAAPAGPVSLSSASAEQLDTLPGVGPVTAQKIVEYRTTHGAFHSVDELDAIPGIGPARLADLRDLVVP